MKFRSLVSPLRTSVGAVLRNYATQEVGKNLMTVPKIKIEEGNFLYLLIAIYIHGETLFTRTIMRGMIGQEHVKLYNKVRDEMDHLGLCTTAMGGGFMNVNPAARTINIYGACKTFGAANHQKAREMLLESEEYRKYNISINKR